MQFARELALLTVVTDATPQGVGPTWWGNKEVHSLHDLLTTVKIARYSHQKLMLLVHGWQHVY